MKHRVDTDKRWFLMALTVTFFVAFGLLLGVHGCEHAGKLRPFTSDGCSRFPDGPPSNPEKWRNCCLEHDLAYWLGGTYSERAAADHRLEQCIETVENPVLAETMWAGVRVGGSPLWPTSFRWGYGWPYSRGYRPVTQDEYRLAQQLESLSQTTNPEKPVILKEN